MANSLRAHLRLSVIEAKRLVFRKQFLLAVAVVLLLVYHDLFAFSLRGAPQGLLGIRATSSNDEIINCFIAAAGGASALAIDTETGFLGLALSRNVRRWEHILHKVVAMWIMIAAISILRLLLSYVVGAFFVPWGAPALGECLEYFTTRTGAIYCIRAAPTTLENAPGPFPALFLTHPVLNDLVGVTMTIMGTSVMALFGFLAAALGANGFVAMSMPVVVAFTVRFLLERLLPSWANPAGFVAVFRGLSRFHGEHAGNVGVWLAGTIGWTVVLVGLTLFIAEKRELGIKRESA